MDVIIIPIDSNQVSKDVESFCLQKGYRHSSPVYPPETIFSAKSLEELHRINDANQKRIEKEAKDGRSKNRKR